MLLNSDTIDLWVKDQPISHWGATTLQQPASFANYQLWIEQEAHASMSYLKDHLPQKKEPSGLGQNLSSALVFAFPYIPHPKGQDFPLKALKIAQYARGEDYHYWIKEILLSLCKSLKEQYPQAEFMVFTDSAPVMERDLAHRAGLGWFGKNTCLIDRHHGSFFLIGEIYTSLKVTEDISPSADFCGTCRACIEACPTQAFSSERWLDAKKCISYMTIESRTTPPLELREKIGSWFFGCDICQSVCPWNQKAFKRKLNFQPGSEEVSRADLIQELRTLLTTSGKKLEKMFRGTALLRAGPYGLRRNALITIGNLGLTELCAEVESFREHERLGELAQWTLEKLQSSKAKA